jgi:CRP/FNR family cyclic AMP-dependent transcriptional regulator
MGAFTRAEGASMTVTASALRGVPLFAGMSDRAIDAIYELMSVTRFATDEDLVRQGDPGESFVVLRDGAASVIVDGRPVRQLGPGDFLGEISLIDGGPRTATVRATAPVTALVIGREDFGTMLERHPAVRLELLMALTARIRGYEQSPTS